MKHFLVEVAFSTGNPPDPHLATEWVVADRASEVQYGSLSGPLVVLLIYVPVLLSEKLLS